MARDLAQLVGNADEFPVLRQWDFFNHAGVSILPRVASDAIRKYATEAENGAYLGTRWYLEIEQLRRDSAALISAEPAEIAMVKNTSEGLAFVANGIDWKRGDRIVTAAVEYPSNVYPWMDVARRVGVELVMVPEETGADGAQRVLMDRVVEAASARQARMVTISHVEYASGQRHDLVRLGKFCRERGILFCVDAIQTLGVLPVDVREMNIDYLSADGHKWLLGPEGAGIFYIRKELIEQTRPSEVGWLNVINPEDFGSYDLTYKPNAGRYEAGSYNVPGLLGLKAAMNLLQGVGIENISARVKSLGDRLIAGITSKGYRVISPRREGEWAGAVSFVSHAHDQGQIVRSLRKDHRTEIALREGRLRVSPHFYNTEEQIDRLIERLPSHEKHL